MKLLFSIFILLYTVFNITTVSAQSCTCTLQCSNGSNPPSVSYNVNSQSECDTDCKNYASSESFMTQLQCGTVCYSIQ